MFCKAPVTIAVRGHLMRKLLKAAFRGDVAEVKNHLTQGIDLNARDEEGWTALTRAASSYGDAREIVRLLIKLEFAGCFGLRSNEIGRLMCFAVYIVATKAVFFLLTFI